MSAEVSISEITFKASNPVAIKVSTTYPGNFSFITINASSSEALSKTSSRNASFSALLK